MFLNVYNDDFDDTVIDKYFGIKPRLSNKLKEWEFSRAGERVTINFYHKDICESQLESVLCLF